MERYREVKKLESVFLADFPSPPPSIFQHSFGPDSKIRQDRCGCMVNISELTRALIDIESTTQHEGPVATYLFDYLSEIAARSNGWVERCAVETDRFNVFASWGNPVVTLSTHMDTVPPFFPAREDAEFIWGRGSADAKGIIASMIGAAEHLLAEGVRNFGLLFVVGEERNSAGAYAAACDPRGSRFLINGEPTEN